MADNLSNVPLYLEVDAIFSYTARRKYFSRYKTTRIFFEISIRCVPKHESGIIVY